MAKISIRLSQADIDTLKTGYRNAHTLSEALHQCLYDAVNTQTLTKNDKLRSITPLQTLSNVKKAQLENPQLCSFRLDDSLLTFLQNYYDNTSISESIRCALYDISNSVGKPVIIKPHNHIIYMLGQKNADMVEWLEPIFSEAQTRYSLTGYVEPFAGTGNVIYHMPTTPSESINDLSDDLINLHRVIKEQPAQLKIHLANSILENDITDTFNRYRQQLDECELPQRRNRKAELKRAVAFYFCRYFSLYGNGTSFNPNKNLQAYIGNLDNIYAFSKRLQEVDIKKTDALYFLKKLRSTADYLIYIDAPYINTEDYYNINLDKKNSVFHSHHALQNRVEALRPKNVCLVSYRITASKATLKHHPKAEMSIRQCLDSLYMNQGYYYRLHKLANRQIEILICTHPLTGFTLYNHSLTEKEVA